MASSWERAAHSVNHMFSFYVYLFFFVFVFIVVLRPGKQFFSHVETEPPIPGYYQYFLGSKCLLLKETNTPTRPRIEPGSPDPKSDALTIRPVRPPICLFVILVVSHFGISF